MSNFRVSRVSESLRGFLQKRVSNPNLVKKVKFGEIGLISLSYASCETNFTLFARCGTICSRRASCGPKVYITLELMVFKLTCSPFTVTGTCTECTTFKKSVTRYGAGAPHFFKEIAT